MGLVRDLSRDLARGTTRELLHGGSAVTFGWGAKAWGGGKISADPDATPLTVTNLDNSGAGSMRAALEASGKRYITFQSGLSGYIDLLSPINVSNGQFTLDGGAAQVLVRGPDDSQEAVTIECSDWVIRHMRFARGDLTESSSFADSLVLIGAHDGWIDHCSIFWSIDGNLDIVSGSGRITVSNTLIAHALRLNAHSAGQHSYSSLVSAASGAIDGITFYRCVWVHATDRNPQIAINGRCEILNCITAGWTSRAIRLVGSGATYDPLVDVIGCLFAQTIEDTPYITPTDVYPVMIDPSGDPIVYINDCWGVNKSGTPTLRWSIGSGGDAWDLVGVNGPAGADEGTYRSLTRVASSAIQPPLLSAAALWASLGPDVGCRPDARLTYEQELVDDVTVMLARSGTQNYGIIDGVVSSIGGGTEFLGGYPPIGPSIRATPVTVIPAAGAADPQVITVSGIGWEPADLVFTLFETTATVTVVTVAGATDDTYTEVDTAIANGSNLYLHQGTINGGALDTTISFDLSASRRAAAAAFAVAGVSGIDDSGAAIDTATGSSAAPSSPTISTVTDNCLIVAVCACVGQSTFTIPDGYKLLGTQMVAGSGGTSHCSMAIATKVQAIAGAVSAASWALDGSREWSTMHFGLAPA